MKHLITMIGFALLLGGQAFASEQSLLARVTVYWHSKGPEQRACSSGARLRAGHCAVDPRKIAYGSKVLFADSVCIAIDTGPDVINRKAARLSGRTPSGRGAVVIDRFFETKQAALAWAKTHPQFMTVRVVGPDKWSKRNSALSSRKNHRMPATAIAANDTTAPKTPAHLSRTSECERAAPLSLPLDSFTRSARRRT